MARIPDDELARLKQEVSLCSIRVPGDQEVWSRFRFCVFATHSEACAPYPNHTIASATRTRRTPWRSATDSRPWSPVAIRSA